MTDLAQLELDLINAIGAASTVAAIEEVRVAALGKTGTVSALLKGMGALSPDERRERGPVINGLRDRVSSALTARKAELEAAELDARLLAERVDLTLPSRPRRKGGVHPTMQVMDEMVAVFADMGFSVAEGPDIEDDFHNFTALNFPPKHPAREMHDTFFLKPDPQTGERKVLRTHTSPVQVRTMMSQKPPIRIIAPGRTFRKDSDATHTPMFHQIEGLVIDRDIHMGHLKTTLETFIARFFELDDVHARFRPHHFPFTEPSAEMDIRCDRSGGNLERGRGLAGDSGLRDGAPQCVAQLRHRSGRVSGLRLRHGRRPPGHVEIRRARPAPHVRGRYALAGALRLLRLRRAEPGVGPQLILKERSHD